MDKVVEELMKERLPIHQKCVGEGFDSEQAKNLVASKCSRIEILDDFGFDKGENVGPEEGIDISLCRCTTYVNPSYWWTSGRRCPMADHYKIQTQAQREKTRVGQQKQKKKK
jgi:hypothetical protein